MNRSGLWLAILAVVAGCDSAVISDLPAAQPAPSAAAPSGPMLAPPQGPQVMPAPPLTADPFLPALSGHRLAVLGDLVLVADPEGAASDGLKPQVHLLLLSTSRLVASFELPDGANPSAVEINPVDGMGYVLARGLGGVYQLDLPNRTLGAFTHLCAAPIDLASHGSSMVVACQSGELVTLTAGVARSTWVAPNLTSVAVDAAGRVYVGTSSAQLIEVAASGPVLTTNPKTVPLKDRRNRQLRPNTARRMVPVAQGQVAMLFQQSIEGELNPENPTPMQPPSGYSGGGNPGECAPAAARPSVGAFRTGASSFGGSRATHSTLAIDLAASADGKRLALADAAGDQVEVMPASALDVATDDTCNSDDLFFKTGGAPGSNGSVTPVSVSVQSPLSVAFAADGRLVAVTGAPSLGVQVFDANLALKSTIAIRSRTLPEGFVLFHSRPKAVSAQASAGLLAAAPSVACASCHPNGLSNGAVTTLAGVKHKVMPLAGRLNTAAIVHWDAKPFHQAIVEETWKTQMGGAPMTIAQEASLHDFLSQLKVPRSPAGDPAVVAAGRAAFEKASCDGCHSGPTLSNDSTANVGQGLHKVPSLLGLTYSGPYMSNGCAATIEERFTNPACGGGDLHGKPSVLSPAERTALVGYLQTL